MTTESKSVQTPTKMTPTQIEVISTITIKLCRRGVDGELAFSVAPVQSVKGAVALYATNTYSELDWRHRRVHFQAIVSPRGKVTVCHSAPFNPKLL